MTGDEFESWLAENFPSQNNTSNRLLPFLALLQEVGGKRLTLKAAWAWKERGVPIYVVRLLPAIEARLASPDARHTFMIPFVLDDAELKALKRTAKRMKLSPEKALAVMARIGFEDECGIE